MKRQGLYFTLFLLVALPLICSLSRCKKVEVHKPGIEIPPGAYIETSENLKFYLDTVASGFTIVWGIDFLNEKEMIITDKAGKLYVINLVDRSHKEITGLPAIVKGGQGGLLDILVHPDYKTNGWIYLAYSAQGNGGVGTAISRAKINGTVLTDLQLLFQTDPGMSGSGHFGCRMQIVGSDLYFGLGERYSAKDQAQILSNHLGKLIRIKDDGTVPPDNPFVGTAGAKPEIWSYGHRNPQGLYYDANTQTLWCHEHGPKGGDELNIIQKGKNYGWPKITFGLDYDGTVISEDTAMAGMEQPVYYWVPSIAPCGLTRIKGDKYPEWQNDFFIGGLVSQSLFRLRLDNTNKVIHQEKLLDELFRVREVAEGPDGYLYISTESPGRVFRLVPVR